MATTIRAPATPRITLRVARVNAPRRVVCTHAAPTKLPAWEYMWQYLLEKELKSISPKEAQGMMAQGDWVLVDVRPKDEFEKSTAVGAVNVPMFQNMDWSNSNPTSLLRAAAYMFNGVKPVEQNPRFKEQLQEACSGKGAILMCETGGTMKPSTNFNTGKTSRSLKAAFIALNGELVPKAAHLEGGLYGWYLTDGEMTAEYDMSNVGRSPNIAEEASGFPTPKQKEVANK